ncbi:hypothetical protein [Mammaliicoccus sciuri]|uniref:hypothetical protein n=1 Tax=Mammaliicoccus sciuri TaxID=1296 RepID=UPI000D1E1477|nr:hypothetical protein [Mammaliicoccus sciuri]PTK05436.1 hypothetical protein BUZ89_13250 [Mammaliicoccus sciuri]RIO04630.1 hypothetical protein BUZ95_11070 [Mammaliicoccus sciuri]RIO10745.1 hypothetical protein BUZ93_13175 [Mammaliicoccus sciuri]
MIKTKIFIYIALILITSLIIPTQYASANSNNNEDELNKQKAVDHAMNQILEKTNNEIKTRRNSFSTRFKNLKHISSNK